MKTLFAVLFFLCFSAAPAFAGVNGGTPDFGRQSFSNNLAALEAGLCDASTGASLLYTPRLGEFIAHYDGDADRLTFLGIASEDEYVRIIKGLVGETAAKSNLPLNSPGACRASARMISCDQAISVIQEYHTLFVDQDKVVTSARIKQILQTMGMKKCAHIDYVPGKGGHEEWPMVLLAGEFDGAVEIFFLGMDRDTAALHLADLPETGLSSPTTRRTGSQTGAATIEELGSLLCRAGLDADAEAFIDLMAPPMIEAIARMFMEIDPEIGDSKYPVWEARQKMVREMENEMLDSRLISCSVLKTQTKECSEEVYTMFETLDVDADISNCGQVQLKSRTEGENESEDMLQVIQINGRWYLGGGL